MPRHAVLRKPLDLAVLDRPRQALGPEEARIEVSFAGVCGTDLAIYKGDYSVPLPLALGHEFSGTVVEAGSAPYEGLLGMRATAEINNTCLARNEPSPCEACRRAMPNHCQTRTVVGIIEHDGAFATELIVPARNVRPIPDSISDRAAVFIEPVAAALQTFEMGPLGAQGDAGFPLDGPPWVAVLGAGRLGLQIAAVAKALGARVIGLARGEAALERAGPYCDAMVCVGEAGEEAAIREVRELTDGLGADYLVEATASARGLDLAARMVRPRGTIGLKSTPGLPVERLDLTRLVVDEIRLQGSRCGPFDKAIEFIAAGKVDLAPLVSEIFALDDAARAIEAAAERAKVLIQCRP